MLDKNTLNELFEYRDGLLFWRVTLGKRVCIGGRAGCLTDRGYRNIVINARHIREHRIIWVMFNGDIPDGFEIDHKDNNKQNNRIDNLRLATKNQNNYNVGISNRNKSGFKGVSLSQHGKSWRAIISISGKNKCLGCFKTPGEAHEAYKEAAIKLHGEFANFG